MGSEKGPKPALLVMGVLGGQHAAYERIRERTEAFFGPLIGEGEFFPFRRYSTYYEEEMGEHLLKSFWAFDGAFPRGALAEAKLATNRIERETSRSGRRTINLDPGLLTPESLVLATTKPYSHRIYLSKGIYAELVFLFRRDGSIEFMPWTYPDYREEKTGEFFARLRKEVLLR